MTTLVRILQGADVWGSIFEEGASFQNRTRYFVLYGIPCSASGDVPEIVKSAPIGLRQDYRSMSWSERTEIFALLRWVMAGFGFGWLEPGQFAGILESVFRTK